jgi:hypothetical protein
MAKSFTKRQQEHEEEIVDFLAHEAWPLMTKLGHIGADGEWTDEGRAWLEAELDKPDGLLRLRAILLSE